MIDYAENCALSRRCWMRAAVHTSGAAMLASQAVSTLAEPIQALSLRADFPIAKTAAYLNNAGSHPLSQGAIDAIHNYLQQKAAGLQSAEGGRLEDEVKSHFAALINAPISSISFVPRTIAGESLVVSALDLARVQGNIVTDELHFQGSLNLYRTLQSRGADVRIVNARNWGIDLADLEKAMDRNTKLVAVSAVSQVNGFQHDLKAVTDLAHSRGAWVYADLVQAVGATPLDV